MNGERGWMALQAAITAGTVLLFLALFAQPAQGEGGRPESQAPAAAGNGGCSPVRFRCALTAVPRAFGRAAKNMVTFRDRDAAIGQWMMIGAVLADARTTQLWVRRCPSCTERNAWLYGRRPSAPRAYITLIGVGMTYSAMHQWVHEETRRAPASGTPERLFDRTIEWALPVTTGISHGWAAHHNLQ